MAEVNKTVRARRNASSQKAIRERAERGETHGNERALVRIGKANTRIITGQEDLSEWDDEELRRGQRRDKNGRFQGQPPKVVPKAIHDELVRRTLSQANDLLNENVVTAVECVIDVIKGADSEDKDRIRAAAMILDRVMGKTPDKVELSAEVKPWQTAINGGIVRIAEDEAETG